MKEETIEQTDSKSEMSGIIQLDEQYSLKKDFRCWVLLYQRKRIDKETGEEKLAEYEPQYYVSVADAVKQYVEQCGKKASGNICNVVNEINAAMARVEVIFKNVPSALSVFKDE
jgi:hypothetical protein